MISGEKLPIRGGLYKLVLDSCRGQNNNETKKIPV